MSHSTSSPFASSALLSPSWRPFSVHLRLCNHLCNPTFAIIRSRYAFCSTLPLKVAPSSHSIFTMLFTRSIHRIAINSSTLFVLPVLHSAACKRGRTPKLPCVTISTTTTVHLQHSHRHPTSSHFSISSARSIQHFTATRILSPQLRMHMPHKCATAMILIFHIQIALDQSLLTGPSKYSFVYLMFSGLELHRPSSVLRTTAYCAMFTHHSLQTSHAHPHPPLRHTALP
jgi:hypothetical protein